MWNFCSFNAAMTGTQRNSFRRLHFDIYFFLLCIFFFDYTSFIHLIVYLYAWDQKWWSSIANIIPMICLQNRRYYATYPVPYSKCRFQKVNDQNHFIWCEFWQIYSYCIFFFFLEESGGGEVFQLYLKVVMIWKKREENIGQEETYLNWLVCVKEFLKLEIRWPHRNVNHIITLILQ